MAQQELFAEGGAQPPLVKLCERCAKRCRAKPKRNPNAEYFVKGDMETGRWCAECMFTEFLTQNELGPASALGRDFWKTFDPQGLRLPHLQQQMCAIVSVAKQHGGELDFAEIDWDEVIANWDLPFPEGPKRGRRKRGGK